MYDWSSVESAGARFENLVASHLLKFCDYREDVYGEKMELRYIRDIDLREIDFVVLRKKMPIFAVECKTGEGDLSPAISYYKERTKIPKFYQVHRGHRDFGKAENGRVLPFSRFCELELSNIQ
jgi:predicted AAA+ superfamily ATPase